MRTNLVSAISLHSRIFLPTEKLGDYREALINGIDWKTIRILIEVAYNPVAGTGRSSLSHVVLMATQMKINENISDSERDSERENGKGRWIL